MQVSNEAATAAIIVSPQVVAGLVAAVVALTTSTLTALVAERKMRRDYKLEFAAERVARQLLESPKWQWRSFRAISHYLKGFEDNELRRILVRAGAVSTITPKGEEVWGLLDRNPLLKPPSTEPGSWVSRPNDQ